VHASIKQAIAAIGLATLLLPSFAFADDGRTSLPPTDGAPTNEQPSTGPVEEQTAPDNSRPALEFVAVVRKPRVKMTCFADPLGAPNVVWLANLGDLPILQGTKIELLIQPGNTTIIFALPYDLWPGWWVELPKGSHPSSKDMSCAVTKVTQAP